MTKNILTIIINIVVMASLYSTAAIADDFYAYAILDKDRNEHTVLNIPKSSVSKYAGWQYQRNGRASIQVWYPSLQDKVSYNYFISTPEEKAAAETKPTSEDRQLSISIGWDPITPPDATLDVANMPVYCDINGHKSYKADGTRGTFRRYINSSRGSASLNIIYLPVEPIKGVYCMACVENANCQLFGVTDSSIPYRAFYDEKQMPDEALAIHQAVGKYLDSKTVK